MLICIIEILGKKQNLKPKNLILMEAVMKKLFLVTLLSVAVAFTACKGKETKVETPLADANANAPVQTEEVKGAKDSDSGNAYGLQTIFFDFDSFSINEKSKTILANNAKILKDKGDVSLQIEGHCDERGSVQYNLALGEKRANAVKKYLSTLGISDNRLTLISYGKEKPMSNDHSEDAWSKNRRANFVVTSK